MNIHLARDGAALGVFTTDEVRAGLASGRFRHNDLAWREGLPAWTALSSWPEFATVTPGAVSVGAAGLPPSELPWEIARGIGSFFRTVWLVMVRPAVLTHARLGAGSVFAAAYLAVGILLVPALLLSPLSVQVSEARTAVIGNALASSANEKLAAIGRGMLESNQEGAASLGAMLCAWSCLLAVYPLVCAAGGMLLWPGIRLQGQKVGFARTLTSSVLVTPLIFLGLFPLTALLTLAATAAPVATILPEFLLGLVAFGLGCRAQGAALAVSGWRVLLAWLMIGVAFCLGCCLCPCAISALAGFRG